jgi:hypothetical protein
LAYTAYSTMVASSDLSSAIGSARAVVKVAPRRITGGEIFIIDLDVRCVDRYRGYLCVFNIPARIGDLRSEVLKEPRP